jgi:hypothetical protein
MTNKDLIKQYANTGAVFTKHQISSLNKNEKTTYFRRRHAQARQVTHYRLQAYELELAPKRFAQMVVDELVDNGETLRGEEPEYLSDEKFLEYFSSRRQYTNSKTIHAAKRPHLNKELIKILTSYNNIIERHRGLVYFFKLMSMSEIVQYLRVNFDSPYGVTDFYSKHMYHPEHMVDLEWGEEITRTIIKYKIKHYLWLEVTEEELEFLTKDELATYINDLCDSDYFLNMKFYLFEIMTPAQHELWVKKFLSSQIFHANKYHHLLAAEKIADVITNKELVVKMVNKLIDNKIKISSELLENLPEKERHEYIMKAVERAENIDFDTFKKYLTPEQQIDFVLLRYKKELGYHPYLAMMDETSSKTVRDRIAKNPLDYI